MILVINATNKKGKIIDSWMTGDVECNAESKEYECGGVYHNNYMDKVGSRDHDCFWDCSGCKRNHIDEMHKTLKGNRYERERTCKNNKRPSCYDRNCY